MGDKCIVCGKPADENCITKDGKTYCCDHCKNHHEDPEKPDTKPNVCEFC